MVLVENATTTVTVGIYYQIAIIGGLCALIGYLGNWISPFARKHRQRVARLDDMLDGWAGSPSRPGFDEIPGVPTRLKSMEDAFEARAITQTVLEHNVAEINKSLQAAHRRLDALGSTIEQEHGEKIAMIRQVQHDVTQTRLIINYINMDRERKEREWVAKLREQGLTTPDASGVEIPSTDPGKGGTNG